MWLIIGIILILVAMSLGADYRTNRQTRLITRAIRGEPAPRPFLATVALLTLIVILLALVQHH